MDKWPRVIYMITHNITGRMYIGSTENFKRRIKNHLYRLRLGKHSIEDMQKDFNDYGENYTIKILGEIKSHDFFRKEYYFMDLYRSRIRGVGYNYKDHKGIPRKTGYYTAKVEIMRSGMEISDVAEKMGVSSGKLSRMLSGKEKITVNEAKLIKEILATDIPIDILFEEAG